MTAATVAPIISYPSAGVVQVTWSGLDGDDYGTPVRYPSHGDKSVQIGAYGGNTAGGATTVMQGSNDPAADPNDAHYASSVWFTLHDTNGDAISTLTSTFKQIIENPLWIRPFQTGGTAGDLDIILICRGRL